MSDRISKGESDLKLGSKRTVAIIGCCAFKGTDNIGSLAGKDLLSHIKMFMQADDEIQKVFTTFGLTRELPTYIFEQMERSYLCLLYKT